MINSWIGLVHTTSAIIALLSGSVVLLNKKGTRFHKCRGYLYLVNMLVANASAFGIYNFGGVSLFHFFAIISLFSVSIGIIPVILKSENWLRRHFYFMNWSVVGLYCALWAEIGVRLFDMKHFWWVVMVATIATSAIGAYVINRESQKYNFT